MSLAEWLRDLGLYSAQVALVAGAAGVLEARLRTDRPRLRLAYWQSVLGLCLVLPLLSSLAPATPPPAAPAFAPVAPLADLPEAADPPPSWAVLTVPSVDGAPAVDAAPAAPAASAWTDLVSTGQVARAVAVLLGAGAALSLGRLFLGLLALRRFRRRGTPLADPEAGLLPASAELRLSTDVASPVTFGFRRPVVLLPMAFLEMTEEERRAVVCHERLHVERRHWLAQLGEELLRAPFWFHPAVHWLIGRIRLAREQAVDAEVVRRLGRRRPYLDSLVRLAARPNVRPPLLASPMSTRSQLAQRVELLLKEQPMSRTRVVASLFASAAAVVTIALTAVSVAPLKAFNAQDEKKQTEPPDLPPPPPPQPRAKKLPPPPPPPPRRVPKAEEPELSQITRPSGKAMAAEIKALEEARRQLQAAQEQLMRAQAELQAAAQQQMMHSRELLRAQEGQREGVMRQQEEMVRAQDEMLLRRAREAQELQRARERLLEDGMEKAQRESERASRRLEPRVSQDLENERRALEASREHLHAELSKREEALKAREENLRAREAALEAREKALEKDKKAKEPPPEPKQN